MIRRHLRLLAAATAIALACTAPSFANFSFSPSGSTTMLAVDASNQGTSLCAAASTECAASVPINTAGSPLFVAANPGLIYIQDGAGNARAARVDAGFALYTDLQAVGGSSVTLAGTGIQLVGIASGSGGNAITATSNALDVNIKSGASGVSSIDEGPFSAGISLFAGSGGFFQTTATDNALSSGQQGMFQITANRALFSNLRNAAGTEVGTATTPLQVSLANTATNGTSVNVAATLNAETTKVIGTVNQGTSPWVSAATLNAETTKVIGTVRNTGNLGGVYDAIVAGTYPANALAVGVLNGSNIGRLVGDETNGLWVNIKAGAGSGGTAIADKAAWTVSSTQFTLAGGEFTTGGATACATGQACTFAMTASRGQFTDVNTWAETSLGAPSAYGTSPGAVNVPGVNAFVTNAVTVNAGTNLNTSALATLANQATNSATTAHTCSVAGFSELGCLGQLDDDVKAPIAAGTNIVGKVGIDQTTAGTTNGVALVGVNAATALAGAGAVGTGSARVAVGQDTTTIAGSAPGTAGSASANVVTVQGVASMTKLLVTPDSVALPANQSVNVAQFNGVTPLMGNGVSGTGAQRVAIASDNTAFSVNNFAQATTAGGSSIYHVLPTAGDNHVVIKNGAGTAYAVHTTNKSATANYLRLYDAGTGFNGCNSATGIIFGMEIPPSDSGFSVQLAGTVGTAFSTGLSICVTSAYGDTDTTAATATSMIVNVTYK